MNFKVFFLGLILLAIGSYLVFGAGIELGVLSASTLFLFFGALFLILGILLRKKEAKYMR